jgi:hypothetical protein
MSIFFNKLIKSTEKFAAGALQEKNCRYNSVFFTAQVAKLVDAGDSKSPAEGVSVRVRPWAPNIKSA